MKSYMALLLAATTVVSAGMVLDHTGANASDSNSTESNYEQILSDLEMITQESANEILTDAIELKYTTLLSFTNEEEEILLKIAMAEAESEGIEGKALVINVVLNRMDDSAFPDNVYDVVFQKNQFSTTLSGGRYYTVTPDDECYEALELVKGGLDSSCGALYFESCTGESWHSKNLEFLFQYGNHRFYK